VRPTDVARHHRNALAGAREVEPGIRTPPRALSGGVLGAIGGVGFVAVASAGGARGRTLRIRGEVRHPERRRVGRLPDEEWAALYQVRLRAATARLQLMLAEGAGALAA
jgi:hypothetical protein